MANTPEPTDHAKPLLTVCEPDREGSAPVRGRLRKRGDTSYFWVELECGPDGHRRQKSAGGFRTRKEAERAFAALRDEVRSGRYGES